MPNREINSYISNKQVGGGPTTFTTPFPLSPLPLRQKGGPTAGGLRWGDVTSVAGEALEGGREAEAGAGVGGWWEQEGEVLRGGREGTRVRAGVGKGGLTNLQGVGRGEGDRQPQPGGGGP